MTTNDSTSATPTTDNTANVTSADGEAPELSHRLVVVAIPAITIDVVIAAGEDLRAAVAAAARDEIAAWVEITPTLDEPTR